MALPSFTVTSKLAEGTQTTVLSVVRVINSLITNLQQIFSSLLNQVQLDSVILSGVALNAGSNTVPHTLGRTLTGWQVIRQSSQSSIWDAQDSNPNPSVNLALVCTQATTVSLLVF